MKPLPIKEQIVVLKKLLQTWDIWGMCPILYKLLKKYDIRGYEKVSDYIPSFTHYNYLYFYPSVKAVQKRKEVLFWDNRTVLGNLRRRWFIRHLIKELKKQL
jgi:hypothetical protein